MLGAIKSFFGGVFSGQSSDSESGNRSIGRAHDSDGFGGANDYRNAEYGSGGGRDAFSAGGDAMRSGEAEYEARLQHTHNANRARHAINNGETTTATAILTANPNVGISIGGVELYGTQGAQFLQRHEAAQNVAAHSGFDRAAQVKADLNGQVDGRTATTTNRQDGMAAIGLPPLPPGQQADPAQASKHGVRMIINTRALDSQGANLARDIARLGLVQYGLTEAEADRYLAANPQATYRSDAGRGAPHTDAELRARVASGGIDNTMTAQTVRDIEAFRRGNTTSHATTHSEGIGSFIDGAVRGNFSDNDSWSSIAGQTAIGFVPILGQVADARDIAAAAKGVVDGEDGSWAGLGIAAVAIIPGLDFLKGGSKVGRRVLKEVAEEGLSDVAREGLRHLGTKLTQEGLERASKEVVVLKVAREEMLVRLESLANDSLTTPEARSALVSARNSLEHSLTQDDLIGALRDVHGTPVTINGKTYDHLNEVTQALNSLESAKTQMLRNMRQHQPSTSEYRYLSNEVEAVSETMRRVEDFLRIK